MPLQLPRKNSEVSAVRGFNEKQTGVSPKTGLSHFGVALQLFGVRLSEVQRGCDPCVYVSGDWFLQDAEPPRLRFCAEFHRFLHDQERDVSVENRAQSLHLGDSSANCGRGRK